jgi:hypothetical protein
MIDANLCPPTTIKLPVHLQEAIRNASRLTGRNFSQLIRESLEMIWTPTRAKAVKDLLESFPQSGAA